MGSYHLATIVNCCEPNKLHKIILWCGRSDTGLNMKVFCAVLSMVATAVVADQLPYQPAPYHAPAPAPYHAPAPAPYHAPAPALYHAPAPAPYHAPVPHPVKLPVPVHAPKPAPYHAPKPAPYHAPKPYVFGYDINDYDPYGRPDVHSRHEESD